MFLQDPSVVYETPDNRIVVNEDKLDLFKYYDSSNIPEWKPSVELEPFTSLSIVYIDIETTGLNPEVDDIILIGMINEKGKKIVIDCHQKEEFFGLLEMLKILSNKNPDIIGTFNGFKFDLPFIIRKLQKYNLANPFWVRPEITTFSTAQMNGSPAKYNSIYYRNPTGIKKHCAVIDLFHQILAWDFVARKLTKHTLKQSVLQTGLRKEARLELSYPEMMAIYRSGVLDQLKEYLEYDLEDTKLLGDFLIPSIYFQKLFLPDWKLQSISHSGNGSKWNSILEREYKLLGLPIPETDPKKEFVGGKTGAFAGFYQNVCKLDVQSMYPSIMMNYNVFPSKDVANVMFPILRYMFNERILLKAIAGNEDLPKEERIHPNQRQGSIKVMINSAYGELATLGIAFNDYKAAALVTAYGRKILDLMGNVLKSEGCEIATCDTDGQYYSTPVGKEQEIFQKVQAVMPRNINLEMELHAEAFFVPPNQDDPEVGLKKHYVIINPYKKGAKQDYIKCTGSRYKKRDLSKLEREFTPTFLKLYVKCPQDAHDYYCQIIDSVLMGTIALEDISQHRKIKSTEIKLVDQGVGQRGEVATFYKGMDKPRYGKKGQILKDPEKVWTKDGECDRFYYYGIIKDMYDEIISVMEKNII